MRHVQYHKTAAKSHSFEQAGHRYNWFKNLQLKCVFYRAIAAVTPMAEFNVDNINNQNTWLKNGQVKKIDHKLSRTYLSRKQYHTDMMLFVVPSKIFHLLGESKEIYKHLKYFTFSCVLFRKFYLHSPNKLKILLGTPRHDITILYDAEHFRVHVMTG